MKCPNCIDLQLVSRRREWLGVEVCPSCHGSWVARRDLEQLMMDSQRAHAMIDDDWLDEAGHSRRYAERGLGRASRYDDDAYEKPRRRRSLFEQIKDFID